MGKGHSYTLSHTGPFAAMTLKEFQEANIRGFQSAKASGLPNMGMHEDTPVQAGATIDWTTKGAVTPVKNQGQCGSCWSFSTTGGLEGAWQLSSGNLVSMSEQQFVDCDTGSSGCNGGLMDQAFGWAENQAIATESSYPYTARDGSCKSSFTTAIPQGGVTGYKDVQTSASGLTSAIMNAPVSVAIEADQAAFQQYTGGVIQSGCGSNLDHGVLAVGVNSDGSIKVKNSWGTSWGVNGYVNIATSQCGITQSASYPVVSSESALKSSELMSFEEYKQQFGKTYNGEEEASRKAIFEENQKLWGQHESGAILGATIFSDMTHDEFKAANIRGLKDASQYGDLPSLGMHEETPVEAGATIDWTTKGAVTPVKNQGQCGSCWSFSTTGGLEGAWQLSYGNLVSMS